MKKIFFLSMSFLLVTQHLQPSTFSQPSNTETQISPSFLPYAHLWFQDFKAKHADAGFDFLTHLISVEKSNPNDYEKMFSTWSSISTEVQSEKLESKGKFLKKIFGKKEALAKLNSICEKLYSQSENLSEKEKQYLDEVSGIFLHEIYHCNRTTPRPTNPIFYFFDRRQEEFDADMHVIKHASVKELQALASSAKRDDEILRKFFHLLLSTPINLLKSLESKSYSSLKPFFTKTIETIDSIQDVITTPLHPSTKIRIKYFSEAAKKKEENLILSSLLQACLINQEGRDFAIDSSEFEALKEKEAPEIIQYFTEKNSSLVRDAQYFKDNNINMLDRLLPSSQIAPFSSSALLAHTLKIKHIN